MFELLVIGILVAVSVFAMGMAMDILRSSSSEPETAMEGGYLDIDLTGCEKANGRSRKRRWQPAPMSEADLQKMTQEVQALKSARLDFDLSEMAEGDAR